MIRHDADPDDVWYGLHEITFDDRTTPSSDGRPIMQRRRRCITEEPILSRTEAEGSDQIRRDREFAPRDIQAHAPIRKELFAKPRS